MAQYKTRQFRVAMVHAIAYMLPFAFFIRPSTAAFAVMLFTHAFIDRFRLARYVVWAKNWIGPSKPWYFVHYLATGGEPEYWTDVDEGKVSRNCTQPTPPLKACPTGYPPNTPAWMAVWLLIIADNTLHLTINYLALRFL
jgi:hypothetical protein